MSIAHRNDNDDDDGDDDDDDGEFLSKIFGADFLVNASQETHFPILSGFAIYMKVIYNTNTRQE